MRQPEPVSSHQFKVGTDYTYLCGVVFQSGANLIEDRGCTLRALIVGVCAGLCIGLGSTYNDMVIKGSRLAIWNLTPAAYFLFFVLVVLVNAVLRRIHQRLALRRGELAVVFFLILLANTLTGRAFSGILLNNFKKTV